MSESDIDFTWKEISHEDALLWLNRSSGKTVQVSVIVDHFEPVLFTEARLSHWTERPEVEIAGWHPAARDERAGNYDLEEVGDLDLSDPDLPCRFKVLRRIINGQEVQPELRAAFTDISISVVDVDAARGEPR